MLPGARNRMAPATLIVCVVLSAAAGLLGLPLAASTVRASVPNGQTCPPQAQIDAALAQASAAMQQSGYSQAAAILLPLSKRQCDPRVSLLLAGAYEAEGDPGLGVQTLQQAHTAWPTDNSLAASLARTYMASHQVAQAAQAVARFRVTPSTPLQEMQLVAVVFMANHQLVAARTVAEAAYRAAPQERTLLLLANALQLQGRFKEVVVLLNGKRGLYGGSAEFLTTLAESEYDSVLYSAARTDLQRATELEPNLYVAHFLLGNALLKLDDGDGAIAEYRRAIELSPQQPRTYYQLAMALQAKQDKTGAQEQLTKALSFDTHYAPALLEMGKILISENRLPEAVVNLNQALSDNPRSEQGYFLLAKAYAQLGDKRKSDEMAQRLVQVRNMNAKSGAKEDPPGAETNP